MKLKVNLEFADFGEEKMAVLIGEYENQQPFVLKINEAAEYLLKLLRIERTEKEIMAEMSRHYGISREQAAADVAEMLGQLREEGLVAP